MKSFSIKKSEIVIFLIIAIGIIALDLYTKSIIDHTMQIGESFKIIEDFFSITCVHNIGAAWGVLPGQQPFFIAISLAAGIGLIYFFKTTTKKQIFARLGITLVFAGMVGNLYDRIVFHYVRDFLDFYIFGYDFPVFNVADMAVVIGVACLMIEILRGEDKWT